MSETDGLISAYVSDAERDAEATVRPRRLAEFIAQDRVRDQLDLLLQGAMRRGHRRITSCSPARPVWVRPASPTSSPPSSARASG
ncbi:hypothetical protein GCM10027614_76520 [Micromonospora vulcania]